MKDSEPILDAKATQHTESVDPSSPVILQPTFGKRLRRPAAVFKSPYVNLDTPVNSRIVHSELCVAMQMFSELERDRIETVFEAPNVCGGIFAVRYMFQSLAPGACIDAGVVDCWVALLNYEESKRKRSSISRLFLYTYVLSEEFFAEKKSKCWNELNKIFKSNLEAFFIDRPDAISFRDFDLVFFPLCRSEHFYLLVYDLRKRPAMHIIDNIIPDDAAIFKAKYSKVVNVVHKLFWTHLLRVKHPSAQSVKALKPSQLNVPWNTKDNFLDCGVFLMRHMESFHGESAASWKCGIPVESERQLLMLLKLRVRYAAKMLTHDINTHAERMLTDARAFSRKYSRTDIFKLFHAGKEERKRILSQS